MSYIPPHLRVSNSRQKSCREAPCFSSSGGNLHARNRELVPDVRIVKSAGFVSRLIVSCSQLVKFDKFEGETFAHLQQHQLYILEAADKASGSEEIYEGSLQEPPPRHIVGLLQEEITRVLEKFKELACAKNAGRVVPLMWLEFGKVLFHNRSVSLEEHRSFTPKEVEMMSGGGREVYKTFDNGVSRENFSLLQRCAKKNSLQSWSNERYAIQVSDEARPNTHLWCVCAYSKGDEHTTLASRESTKLALTLLKVKLIPIRYLISDVAFVGKSYDIRLKFFTKNYLTALSEEESEDLEACLSKASIDHSAKGGLRWPLGSKQSTSGRFKVVGSVHQMKEFFVDSRLRWSLKRCNRVEFKASSGRISYEVSVRPNVYHKFCKAQEDRAVEELMSSVADTIQEVWEECVES
ncbi:hypothetical protein L7F22_005643 [Adiantum nelumboides]|nr:hypothetical protein [Adiantum nelumboides]